MSLERYFALIREQQQKLSGMADAKGILPLRRIYDSLIAQIGGAGGSGKMDIIRKMQIMAAARAAMIKFVRQGADVLNAGAAHIVTKTAGQAFTVLSQMERDRTGRSLVMSEAARDKIAAAQPAPSTLLGSHERSLARYGAHMIGRIDDEVSTGISLGETHTQVVDRIMGTADLEFYQAERIARTELSYAGNSTSRGSIEAESEILNGTVYTQWHENADEDGRPLDTIVCVDSLALHGQIAAAGEEFEQPPTSVFPDFKGRTEVPAYLVGKTWPVPPNRPNDRSIVAPWRPHWGTPGWRWENNARVDKRRPIDEVREEEPQTDEQAAAAQRVQRRYADAMATNQGTEGFRLPASNAPPPPARGSRGGGAAPAAAVEPAPITPLPQRSSYAQAAVAQAPRPPAAVPAASAAEPVHIPAIDHARIDRANLAAIDQMAQQEMATVMPKTVTSKVTAEDHARFERQMERELGKPVTVADVAHAYAPPPGYRAEIVGMPTKAYGGAHIEVNYYDDKTGKLAARMDRSFTEEHVHHTLLMVEPGYQGAGFGDHLNGQAFLRYKKWGVQRVSLDAEYVGRYAWARMGMNFEDPERIFEVGSAFIEKHIPTAEQAARKAALRELVKEPWKLAKWDDGSRHRISHVVKYDESGQVRQEGEFHLGKAILLHDDMKLWQGTMELSEENPGYLNAIRTMQVEKRK